MKCFFHHLSFILLIVLCENLFSQSSAKKDTLPAPYATKSANNFCDVIGWKDAKPKAPEGFIVDIYSDGFENPRWMCVTPNGDVLVAESNSNYNLAEQVGATVTGAAKSKDIKRSADRITILRDKNNDGRPDVKEIFLQDLNQPFGMLIIGNWLYVANTNSVVKFPYKAGELKITAPPVKLVDLPAGEHNRHWTRNIITNHDSTKIYIAVGCGSDHAENGIENEILRANILEMNLDGSDLKVYASGLRNPVGMGWAPGTKTLWTVVNERDQLGDNLVPDYLTSVKPEGFYGWPYSYYGQHEDPRVKIARPELVLKAIVPDMGLGAHTASLGLLFYNGNTFPEKYHNGAFIAQHGSWNRSVLSGYKVLYVPFKNGKPASAPEDFLTGFIANSEKNEVHGRPVGLAVLKDGSLLVTDDVTNTIWRVSAKKKAK
jgi:glucose/arabinose dehydrogenase